MVFSGLGHLFADLSLEAKPTKWPVVDKDIIYLNRNLSITK